MNFTTLQQLTRERVGAAASDNAVGAANTGRLAGMVKQALRRLEVSSPNGWNWMRVTGNMPTVTSQEQYTFSAIAAALGVPTITKLVQVKIQAPQVGGSSRFPLKRFSRQDADTRYPFTNGMCPQVWWTEGLVMGLRPIPDAVYTLTISAIQGETNLTAGSDVPIMPEQYHDAIIEKAAELWFRSVHDISNAQLANASASEWISLMRQSQRPYIGAGRVTVEGDDWG